MATTRQNPASPSRFSWLTFGLGSKSANASLDRVHESELDDPWYIPYSGPVEPPREPFRRRLERDSWGDPIERDEEEDTTDVRHPYEVGSDLRHPFARGSQVPGVGSDSFQTGRRVRTRSAVSGRTLPSESSRASIASPRRLTMTSPQRLPAPLPASGGVGESPMPPSTHHRTASKERNGTGIAGFFSFGGQTRKRSPSEKEPKLLPKIFTKTELEQPSARLGSAGHRRSSSTGSNLFLGHRNLGNGGTKVAGIDDYYHTSYHFTTKVPRKTRVNVNPESSYGSTSSIPRREQQMSTLVSNTRHPYSYVFPSSLVDNGPQTAPLPSTDPIASSSTHAVAPTLTFSEPEARLQKSTGLTQVRMASPRPFSNRKEIKRLKNSASTPDLRTGSVPNPSSQLPTKASPTIKMKERWLSAETWCDALLFPRPRLKKTCDKTDAGRIVSLPPSPVNQSGNITSSGVSEQGVASRVLAHSRSLADLDKARQGPSIKELGTSSSSTGLQPQFNSPSQMDRPHRPKSWALDDLALPTPVPSLSQVLEEGEKFENQRKQWQDQATKSFQNKRTRNISRSRSKSLTHKGRKNDGGRPSNIDFLAARACLGNQILTPVVVEHKSKSCQSIHFATGPLTRTSRSHSNHTRVHSRSDSFGRTVPKKAKPVGHDGGGEFFTDNELENALKGDGTKIIRLADPALAPNPTLTSGSPTSPVSFVNDARIGIALTTPPLVDDPDGVEAMRLPSHPYAQGGLYSFRSIHPESGVPDYDVPDSQVEGFPKETSNNIPLNSRSRATGGPIATSCHPYAQQSSRDTYLPDTKYTYSDIPAPSRMWAQLSSGIITEVRPDDIQYSPFISENSHEPESDDFTRNSRVINDTVGIGEALAFAVSPRTSKDSGLGTSEEHTTADPSYQVSAQAPKKSYRQPVQYDATRLPHLPLQTTDHDSAHTFASSPLLHQQQSAPDILHYTMPPIQATRINASPDSLSPRSLRSISDPDDLEGFYDLFYDPNRPTQHMASGVNYAPAADAPIGSRRGAESELASLARQLSQELEQMTLEQEDSQYWRSSMEEFQSSIARKPTGSTLEFVFEETSSPGSGTTGLSPPGQHTISPFQPSSARIPEDVELSRASSPIEPDKDENEIRVGVVESTTTPPIVDREPRASVDQMSSPVDREGHANGEQETSHEQENSPQLRMQPPSADPTRSSYTTSSTMSRMSTLSDFPAPPPRHAVERMSLLTSYEAPSLSEVHDSRTTTTPLKPASFDDTIMGHSDEQSGGEEIEDLVAALSSHSHSTARHN